MVAFFKNLKHHWFWHIVIALLTSALSTLWQIVFEKATFWQGLEITYGYVKQEPLLIAAPSIFVAVLFGCRKLLKKVVPKLIRGQQLESLVQKVGLRSFSTHSERKEKTTNWDACKKDITASMSAQLNILGSGGYETFSASDAPLYELVTTFQGELRILLLDPLSPAFRQRCANVNVSESVYCDWIYKSIELCQRLKSTKNQAVEIRLYSDYPIWKMIFTTEYMWLQWYQNTDVDNTPVYCFQTIKDEQKTSLYYPLTSVFLRRWEGGTRIDLNTWVRPSSALISNNNSLASPPKTTQKKLPASSSGSSKKR